MTNCSGNCSSCKQDKRQPSKKTSNPVKQPDITDYLKPLPQPRKDKTDLFSLCTCPDSPRVPRYQCWKCIESWVNAVCKCTAAKMVKTMKDKGCTIAVERLERAIEEKKRRLMFKEDDSCTGDCGSNCSCKKGNSDETE